MIIFGKSVNAVTLPRVTFFCVTFAQFNIFEKLIKKKNISKHQSRQLSLYEIHRARPIISDDEI